MVSALALVALAAFAPFQDPATSVVQGRVRSQQTGAPLSHTIVEIRGVALPLVALTDSTGFYRIEGVPPGRRILRATRFDHNTFELEVLVPDRREVELDLVLSFRPVLLPEVTNEFGRLPVISDTAVARVTELGRASVRTLEASPGMTELGLGAAVNGISGLEPIDPSDVLYVRGSAADLKLVLLDGAPAYSPFHLGGLIAPFETGLIRSANLYLGGAPARYDGGVSYVLDLETRAGSRLAPRADVVLDLVSARAMAEGPIGERAGFLLSGRTVHDLTLLANMQPYAYGDVLGRVDVDVRGGVLGVTTFWNEESIALSGDDYPVGVAEWGNTSASIRYQREFRGGNAQVTVAHGRYRARLPMNGHRPMVSNGVSGRTRVGADMARDWSSVRVRYGTSFERVYLDYSARSEADTARAFVLETRAVGDVVGGYADVTWLALPRVLVRGGVRADGYSVDGSVRLAPRASATWVFTDRAALTVAAGRYHQLLRNSAAEVVKPVDDGESSLYVPPPLSVVEATHVFLGLDQLLIEGFRLGIEGYYKLFNGLPAGAAFARLEPEIAARPTRAHASGLDLWLRRDEGRVTGWVNYSLGWVWSASGSGPATDLFAGRQLLNTGVAVPLGATGRFDFRVSYGAGLPYTAVPAAVQDPSLDPGLDASQPLHSLVLSAEPPAETEPGKKDPPDSPFLRIDLEVSHQFEDHWRGHPVTLIPYIRVLNALDRRDAMFYHVSPDGSGPRALSTMPLMPIVGLRLTF